MGCKDEGLIGQDQIIIQYIYACIMHICMPHPILPYVHEHHGEASHAHVLNIVYNVWDGNHYIGSIPDSVHPHSILTGQKTNRKSRH